MRGVRLSNLFAIAKEIFLAAYKLLNGKVDRLSWGDSLCLRGGKMQFL
jgi:hypothetical protein